jgi:hypothetical protein
MFDELGTTTILPFWLQDRNLGTYIGENLSSGMMTRRISFRSQKIEKNDFDWL